MNIGRYAWSGGYFEVAPGKLLIAVSNGVPANHWGSLVVDLERGVIERSEPHQRPAAWSSVYQWYDLRRISAGSRAFIDEHGSLVRWDPLKGDREIVIRGKVRAEGR